MTPSNLIEEAKDVLIQLVESIGELTLDEYTEKIETLSGSSIGQHTRHILELFHQLDLGYVSGIVNYDDRKRDLRLERDIDFAMESIANIIHSINKEDKNLKLVTLYNEQEHQIESNYYREIMYNIEHCIHHQALMKIGLNALGKNDVSENLGVAKSTLAYRKECAQ